MLRYRYEPGSVYRYEMMRKVWRWTTSNSPSLRLFLFSLAVLLYNIWVLTKLLSDNHNKDKEEEERMGMLTWTIRFSLELSPMLKEMMGHSSIYCYRQFISRLKP